MAADWTVVLGTIKRKFPVPFDIEVKISLLAAALLPGLNETSHAPVITGDV
jgi:hypothetical protein